MAAALSASSPADRGLARRPPSGSPSRNRCYPSARSATPTLGRRTASGCACQRHGVLGPVERAYFHLPLALDLGRSENPDRLTSRGIHGHRPDRAARPSSGNSRSCCRIDPAWPTDYHGPWRLDPPATRGDQPTRQESVRAAGCRALTPWFATGSDKRCAIGAFRGHMNAIVQSN